MIFFLFPNGGSGLGSFCVPCASLRHRSAVAKPDAAFAADYRREVSGIKLGDDMRNALCRAPPGLEAEDGTHLVGHATFEIYGATNVPR